MALERGTGGGASGTYKPKEKEPVTYTPKVETNILGIPKVVTQDNFTSSAFAPKAPLTVAGKTTPTPSLPSSYTQTPATGMWAQTNTQQPMPSNYATGVTYGSTAPAQYTSPVQPAQEYRQPSYNQPSQPAQQGGDEPLPMTPEQQEAQAESIGAIDDTISNGFRQLQEEARAMGNEGLIMLAAQWEQMAAMLDGLQQQITDQITGQMRGDDPAMQEALRVIREEADRMRKETLDELNARGLVQSGVYAQALSDINNSQMTQSQAAIASRFGDLQNQLNNAIMSLAQTRIGALSAHQGAVTNMQMNTQQNVLQSGLAGLNAAVTMRDQSLRDQQFYAGLQSQEGMFDKQYSQNAYQFNVDQGNKYTAANTQQDIENERYEFAKNWDIYASSKAAGGEVATFITSNTGKFAGKTMTDVEKAVDAFLARFGEGFYPEAVKQQLRLDLLNDPNILKGVVTQPTQYSGYVPTPKAPTSGVTPHW